MLPGAGIPLAGIACGATEDEVMLLLTSEWRRVAPSLNGT
jgi:hypothetical protein